MKIIYFIISLIFWSSCSENTIINKENITTIQGDYEYETIEISSDIPIVLDLYGDGIYIIENGNTRIVQNKSTSEIMREISDKKNTENNKNEFPILFGNTDFYTDLQKAELNAFIGKSTTKLPEIKNEIHIIESLNPNK